MLKVLGLVTGALAAAAGILAVTGVPHVAGVDWHSSTDEATTRLAPETGSDTGLQGGPHSGPTEPPRARLDNVADGTAGDESPDAETVADAITTPAPEAVLASNDAGLATRAVVPASAEQRAIERQAAEAADEDDAPTRPEKGPTTAADVDTDSSPVDAVDDMAARIPDPDAESTIAGDNAPDVAGESAPSLVDLSGTDADTNAGPAVWHPVWAPFRSELSARGFMQRLERLTDLSYRVSKVGPGLYQVAFAHADAGERATGIAAIEQATGLDLGGVRP